MRLEREQELYCSLLFWSCLWKFFLFPSQFFNKIIEIMNVVFLRIYVWIQCNNIYQYNLKAVVQSKKLENGTVCLSFMRRNLPFPRVPGSTAELSPSQQWQQKEPAGTRVRTMRVKLCVGEICPLVGRENISPPRCAVSGSGGCLNSEEVMRYFILFLETRQLFSHKFTSAPFERWEVCNTWIFFFFSWKYLIISVFNTGNSHFF